MNKYSIVMTATVVAEKPYHAKRPHRKSRTGCRNCKARKVKCDEGRPACRACSARNEQCIYAITPKRSPTSAAAKERSTALALPAKRSLVERARVVEEPLFIPSGRDEMDMRLLWFYTTNTWISYSTGSLKFRSVDKVLKVNVYLNDLKDYDGMNAVFRGRFGSNPPVRTTIAAAGGIPGNSLVEIDCIAYR